VLGLPVRKKCVALRAGALSPFLTKQPRSCGQPLVPLAATFSGAPRAAAKSG
jgi:hypothetical protein